MQFPCNSVREDQLKNLTAIKIIASTSAVQWLCTLWDCTCQRVPHVNLLLQCLWPWEGQRVLINNPINGPKLRVLHLLWWEPKQVSKVT